MPYGAIIIAASGNALLYLEPTLVRKVLDRWPRRDSHRVRGGAR